MPEENIPQPVSTYREERDEVDRSTNEARFNFERGLVRGLETQLGENGYDWPAEGVDAEEVADTYRQFGLEFISGKGQEQIQNVGNIEDDSFVNALLHGVLPRTNLVYNMVDQMGTDVSVGRIEQTDQFQEEMQTARQARASDLERAAQELSAEDVVNYTGIDEEPYDLNADRIRDNPQIFGPLIDAKDEGQLEQMLRQGGFYQPSRN